MARRSMPLIGDCFRDECPARDVLNHVSNRWGGLVLGALLERDLRYSEIRARVGGSRRRCSRKRSTCSSATV